MRISRILLCGLLAVAFAAGGGDARAVDPAKVLRLASPDIDTLDPQQYTDDPSFQVLMAIFEPAYEWDYLATTPRLVPLTAEAPVALTDGGRTWTYRIRKGITFHPDPAFGGKPRELTAADYVYSYKRWMDPNGRRGGAPIAADLIIGARPVVDAARRTGKFDFDQPIEGLRALDRYTVQMRLNEPNFPIIRDILGFVGAAAREVVEAAGPDIRIRAVGTGPYRLRDWKRGSRIVLDGNPDYRSVSFPESRDAAQASLVRAMRGKVLPQIGVIDIAVIDEDLPRLLQFEQGGLDLIVLRGEVANRLLTDGKLKPDYASRGIQRHVYPEPFLFSVYFNIADPARGGLAPERIALRRAIATGLDLDTLLKVVYAGQAIPANQMVPPGVGGHDPASGAGPLYDPAAARALLDRFGYRPDATGYRTTPDGKALTLTLSQRTGPISREIGTLWKKNMDAIGLRIDFQLTPFQDMIKALEKGQFQMYYGGFGGSPSGYNVHAQLHGKQPQRVNTVQFKHAEYDAAAEAFLKSESDADQIAAARRMSQVARNYMPLLPAAFRLESVVAQPWVQGLSPMVFSTYWKYLDIDLAERRAVAGK
jgi:oligopeptide transport system substrate-binding protein